MLTKELWDGHPCCAFAASREFVTQLPNTYAALVKAIIEATAYADKAENRREVAKAIAPANYLNQPETVIEQILTGTFANGLGQVQRDPKRISFDPFPWESFAIWIMSQMKRWGQIRGDVDYQGVARQVYLATDARRLMREVGLTPPESNTKTFSVMGKPFDPASPRSTSPPSRSSGPEAMLRSINARAGVLSVAILVTFLLAWHIAVSGGGAGTAAVDPEYAKLVGAAAATGGQTPMPGPLEVGARLWHHLKDPVLRARHERHGGRHPARLFAGARAARLPDRGGRRHPARLPDRHVADGLPRARPLHPGDEADLAARLDAARALHDQGQRHLLDLRDLHLLGLADADQHRLRRRGRAQGMDQRRRTLEVGPFRKAFTVILPAAAPTILTGMRISIGIAWLVIVAAEMLVGGTGIGYFVWNQWNNLSLTDIITAILLIGVVGMILDQILARAAKAVTYPE